MKSLDLEEQLEADVYDSLPSRNDSSSGDGTKRKSSSYRSKHSESEQRRRSKINERFQTLMDIIPLNDQKRDKASFLLEVIEYIQFLQEKLQIYEKPHQLWNQGPTKLIPWRNNHRVAEEVSDQSQIIKSWLGHDKGGSPPGLLSDTVVESASVMKILEQNPIASFTPAQPQLQIAQLDSVQPRLSSGLVTCNRNESANLNGNTSAVCSQGLLNTLTKELKSLGVNMSETMISVDLNLGKRRDPEFPVAASEENGNSILNKERGSQDHDHDHAQKRIRR